MNSSIDAVVDGLDGSELAGDDAGFGSRGGSSGIGDSGCLSFVHPPEGIDGCQLFDGRLTSIR
jgi:hypothetical protein